MSQTIRLTTCLAENSEPLCRQLAGLLSAKLGVAAQVVSKIPWTDRAQQLAEGTIQMGWICGLLFMRLRQEQNSTLKVLAAPVMAGKAYANQPVYFSYLVAQQDSPFASLADLRGKRWGFNEPGSFSGYAIVRHHLAQLGETDSFFGEWVESGSHFNSLQMLLDGRIDATALDSTLLDYWKIHQPGWLRQIRIIGRLGPNPSPPMVISAHVPGDLRQQLQQLLLNLHDSRKGRLILASSGVCRFTAVPDQIYTALYEISQI
jgi:phosphonate transport system substrate-binding protein